MQQYKESYSAENENPPNRQNGVPSNHSSTSKHRSACEHIPNKTPIIYSSEQSEANRCNTQIVKDERELGIEKEWEVEPGDDDASSIHKNEQSMRRGSTPSTGSEDEEEGRAWRIPLARCLASS